MTGENAPFTTPTVSVRGLAIAKASIAHLREEARLVRAQAEALAAAKRRSPSLFREADIRADLAEAERLAARHERRADEIEERNLVGLLSRPAEETKAEAVERRARAAEDLAAGVGLAPDPWTKGAAITSGGGIRPVAISTPATPEPAAPAFEVRPVAIPTGFRAITEEA